MSASAVYTLYDIKNGNPMLFKNLILIELTMTLDKLVWPVELTLQRLAHLELWKVFSKLFDAEDHD